MARPFDILINLVMGKYCTFYFWGAIAGAVGGILGGKASEGAAEASAAAKDYATKEQGRQFDITQEQLEPWREVGKRNLIQYEDMLDDYGNYDIPSNIPDAYISPKNLPEVRNFESGDYFDRIQSDIPDEFSYSNEDFQNSAGRQSRVQGGLDAVQQRLGDVSGLEELSQNLANREYGKSRERAFQDYSIGADRERDRYTRGVEEYGRLTGREADLYNRDRQGYLYDVAREDELMRRGYRDYTTEAAREEENYRRGLEAYGREYVDPLNRRANLAGIGQATTEGLGGLRQSYSNTISRNIADAGRVRAAGTIGSAQAYATGISNIGKSFNDRSY